MRRGCHAVPRGLGAAEKEMRDGLLTAQGGSPNFGDSQAAVTLGAVSGAAPRCPPRGAGGALLAGRAGAGTAAREGGGEGSPSSLCQEKRRRLAAGVSCRAGTSPEARTGARVTRPRGRGARPGAGPHTPGGARKPRAECLSITWCREA